MKEPVDHILRPLLPWRESQAITECGYNASKVKALTRDEYFQRRKDLGQQRCAMLTCMTCSQTAERHATWEDDLRAALMREILWEGYNWLYNKDRNGTRLRDELLSVAALIEAHRDEFQAHISATEQRREWLEKKAAHAKTQPRKDVRSL